MLGIERNLSPRLPQTKRTPKQSKGFTKWLFLFSKYEHDKSDIVYIAWRSAKRHKHENKVKRQHFFHVQNKSCTSTMMVERVFQVLSFCEH